MARQLLRAAPQNLEQTLNGKRRHAAGARGDDHAPLERRVPNLDAADRRREEAVHGTERQDRDAQPGVDHPNRRRDVARLVKRSHGELLFGEGAVEDGAEARVPMRQDRRILGDFGEPDPVP